MSAWAVIGGGIGLVLGLHRALRHEELAADLGIEQLHAAGKIPRHRLEPGSVAVKDVGEDLQSVHHGLEHAGAEGGDVMGRAVIHQREQQRLGEDVDLQGFAALGKGGWTATSLTRRWRRG